MRSGQTKRHGWRLGKLDGMGSANKTQNTGTKTLKSEDVKDEVLWLGGLLRSHKIKDKEQEQERTGDSTHL